MESKLFFFWLLFIGCLNAIVISGDDGVLFAKNKSAEMCSDPRVSEIFICFGNIVKVVWAESEKGTTFYAPTGKITDCPPVPQGQASAECVRFLMPNYCVQKFECEKTQEIEEGIVKNETTPENITEKPSKEQPSEKPEDKPTESSSTFDNRPVVIPYNGSAQKQTARIGDMFNSSLFIVLAAMIVLLIALYFIFKKTVRPT